MPTPKIYTFSLADKPNRLANIKFLTRDVPRGGFIVHTFPVEFGEIYYSKNRKNATTVATFLQELPTIELEAWLRARDIRWGKWLDTGVEE